MEQRADKIAEEMLKIDSITDFSSNKNKPVNDVENIGINNYNRIRNFNNKGLVKHTVLNVNHFTAEDNNIGPCYKVIYTNAQGDEMSFYLMYYKRENLFKIEGW